MIFSSNKLTFGLLPDSTKTAQQKNHVELLELEQLDLNKIVQVDFPENQYYKFETNKTQIVLHHTVSGDGVDGDIKWWIETPERVATSFVIGRDGTIYQCYSTKYWAHHLGIKVDLLISNGFSDSKTRNELLNKGSIGIEIDSWGGLAKSTNGKWYPAAWDAKTKKYLPNKNFKPVENVEEYPDGFMGFYAFEKYTPEQLDAIRKLLVYLSKKFNIPLEYKGTEMWGISKRALSGEPGIWTHVSFLGNRKSDCHPQGTLINTLKYLK